MAKRIRNLQASKIASIEEELRVLKAQLRSHPAGSKIKRFSDLADARVHLEHKRRCFPAGLYLVPCRSDKRY